MSAEPSTSTELRPWQEVARERGISQRILADMLGIGYSALRQYSAGRVKTPAILLVRMSRHFGEPVR